MATGEKRLKRYAQQQTNAAEDSKHGNKPSALKRSLLNCAIAGGIAMTGENLWNSIINHKGPDKDTIKAGAIACSTAAVSGPLKKRIKPKGYDMED
jgi:hypothetical protein